jgi:hypothetical protein
MDPILPNIMQFADRSFGYLAVGTRGFRPPDRNLRALLGPG